MFTSSRRAELRALLLDRARADERIVAAAIVGSAAAGREDGWSDIDLAFRLRRGEDAAAVAQEWTAFLTAECGVADHLDIWAHGGLYRVFLLPDTLQVDLSFWPFDDYAATSPAFRLEFGEAGASRPVPAPSAGDAARTAWLFALHARSSIARGRALQALYMLNTARDHLVQAQSVRHALAPHHARGADDLPGPVRAALASSVPASLERAELARCLRVVCDLIGAEAGHVDEALAARLRPVLAEIAASIP
jgi:hypothetical protein